MFIRRAGRDDRGGSKTLSRMEDVIAGHYGGYVCIWYDTIKYDSETLDQTHTHS